jgi:hypothetical protein
LHHSLLVGLPVSYFDNAAELQSLIASEDASLCWTSPRFKSGPAAACPAPRMSEIHRASSS